MRAYWRGTPRPPQLPVDSGLGGHYAPVAGVYFGTNALERAFGICGLRDGDKLDAAAVYSEGEKPWEVAGSYVVGSGNHSKIYVFKGYVVLSSQNNGRSAACEHAIVLHGQEIVGWAKRQIERAAKAFGTPESAWEAPVLYAPDADF